MSSKKLPDGVQTKKIVFHGKTLTLYSLDGNTWSSRVEELSTIQDRHNHEQAGYSSDLKGEEKERPKFSIKPRRTMQRRPIHEAFLDDDEPALVEDIDVDIPDVDIDEDFEAPDIVASEKAVRTRSKAATPSKKSPPVKEASKKKVAPPSKEKDKKAVKKPAPAKGKKPIATKKAPAKSKSAAKKPAPKAKKKK